MPTLFFRAIPVLALGGWDSYGGVYLADMTVGMLQVMIRSGEIPEGSKVMPCHLGGQPCLSAYTGAPGLG